MALKTNGGQDARPTLLRAGARLPALIAPAGGPDAMRAAVENGADGVYFGLPQFNARMRAENFTLEDLPCLTAWLHERGVRAYVTLNTLIFDEELQRAGELFAECARAGADAIMVQDLGFAALAGRVAPGLPLHASTQMTLTCAEALRAAQAMGLRFERMVAARELTLEELRRLRADVEIKIEVFAHGALCISVSGQCQASFAMGGRSANRGECAQACRLPYEILADGRVLDTGGAHYPLSPRDLAALDDLPALIETGVDALKIEGRMKSAQYVAAVVSRYREALERAGRNPAALENSHAPAIENALAISNESTRRELEIVFSRGFSHGFLRGANPRMLVDGPSPKHRGTLAGRVIRGEARGVLASLEAPLKPGDGVVFDGGETDGAGEGGRIYEVIPAGTQISSGGSRGRPAECRDFWLTFGDEKLDPRKIPAGVLIWKTSDPALEAALNSTFQGEKIRFRRPVRAQVEGGPGRCLRLRLVDWDGIAVDAEDSEPAGTAENRPLDEEILRNQLGRLGATPFYLDSLEARLDGPTMVPMSRLNALRRRAADELLAKRRAIGTGRQVGAAASEMQTLRAELGLGARNESLAGMGPVNPGNPGNPGNPISRIRPISRIAISPMSQPGCAAQSAQANGAAMENHASSSPRVPAPVLALPRLSILCRTLDQILAAAGYRPSASFIKAFSGAQPSGNSLSANSPASDSLFANPLHVIYAEMEDFPQYREARELLAGTRARFGVVALHIIKPGEAPLMRQWLKLKPGAILAQSLAALDVFKEFLAQAGGDGAGIEIVGGAGLNAANSLSAGLLRRLGLSALTPSPELDQNRLLELLRLAPPEWFEAPVYFRPAMFHMQFCLYCRHLSAGTDASNCGRPCRRRALALRDRKRATHPVRADYACRNTVFRNAPEDTIHLAGALWGAGLRRFRMEFLDESPNEMLGAIRRYEQALLESAADYFQPD